MVIAIPGDYNQGLFCTEHATHNELLPSTSINHDLKVLLACSIRSALYGAQIKCITTMKSAIGHTASRYPPPHQMQCQTSTKDATPNPNRSTFFSCMVLTQGLVS